MAKIIIKKENLPNINPITESYSVRYRLTTEDRNRFSYWSPIFDIPANISYDTVSGSVTHSGNLITTVWDNVANVSSYDIWVAWANSTTPTVFNYYGTFSQNMANIFNPSTYNRFSINIYVANQDRTQQYSNFLIYQNLNIHI
jgi:hypothetical protein